MLPVREDALREFRILESTVLAGNGDTCGREDIHHSRRSVTDRVVI
jgi:hypothetical protein